MRAIDSDFASRLVSGVTTTCLCWRLTRADGLVVGATDHDRALSVDGVTYSPGASVESGALTASTDFKPGQASGGGALNIEAITEDDLAAGLWDRARVDVFRVDWRRPEFFVLIWSGFLSEIEVSGGAFEAQLVSLKAELERPVGRVFSRRCDAALGDGRCGVDLSDPSFAGLTCDKRFETCKSVFSNTDNFRGFPHMPGNDFVLSGPAANTRRRGT